MPMLRVDGVTSSYGVGATRLAALREVSFELRRGERLGIVGESGAGKSTLLRCLNLLVKPDAGLVEINGRVLTRLDPGALGAARRDIGMVFQHFALMHRRTVRDNIALPLELAGLPRPRVDARVTELLERVRLADKARAWPGQLSGGQRQRVGIARALAHAPPVLLCDEPTSALDAETARHIVQLLDRLCAELQLTIVFVTHQLELVRGLADRVAVLERGRLQELTAVGDFFAAPRSEAGRRLLRPAGSTRPPDGLLRAEPPPPPATGASTLLTLTLSPETPSGALFRVVAQHDGLHADVVSGHVEAVRGQAVGSLSLLVRGAPATIASAVEALEAQSIRVEVREHAPGAA